MARAEHAASYRQYPEQGKGTRAASHLARTRAAVQELVRRLAAEPRHSVLKGGWACRRADSDFRRGMPGA